MMLVSFYSLSLGLSVTSLCSGTLHDAQQQSMNIELKNKFELNQGKQYC